MIDKIVNLISGRSITDICRHETGGLGVDCVIDNGGKCIYMYQGLWCMGQIDKGLMLLVTI